MTTGLQIWVVYDSPSDRPGVFVSRKWINDVPTEVTVQAPTLDALRGKLPAGLYCIPRSLGDDPRIVECWI